MLDKKTLKTFILVFIFTIFILILPFIIIFIWSSFDLRADIFLNWHVMLPKYENVRIVDLNSYVHSFYIYTLFEDREKTIKSLKMKKITVDNQNTIKDFLDGHYEFLKGEERKKIDDEIENNSLLDIGNYYSYIPRYEDRTGIHDDFMLIILSSDNKLYVFEHLS